MEKVIKRYQGKLGIVTVTEYNELGNTDYGVKHSNEQIGTYWCKDKREAIVHAQFLAGKY